MIKAPRTNKLERKEKKGKEREGKGMRGEGKGGEEQDRWEGKGRKGKKQKLCKKGKFGSSKQAILSCWSSSNTQVMAKLEFFFSF